MENMNRLTDDLLRCACGGAGWQMDPSGKDDDNDPWTGNSRGTMDPDGRPSR